jgi:phosphomannomutase/phosphoglucomutase
MAMSEQRLFGTNGIRGIFGKDLSVDFIVDVSRAIGVFFDEGPIVLGYDGRSSSFIISKIVTSVMMSMGIDVYNMGLTPTPCLQFTVKDSKFKGGIMITASHNPPEYNGLKPISHTGIEISREDEKIIEDIYYKKRFERPNPANFGNSFTLDSALNEYVNRVLTLVDVDAIKDCKFKIVMDFGNGVQSLVAPIIAKKLGCEVLTVNGNMDSAFSARGSEPKMDNLGNLSYLVKETNADLGVAYDGDGDRSIFCDEKGVIHWGDKTGSVLAHHLIGNKSIKTAVVCPINSSLIISKICDIVNSKTIFTKVGSVEVSYGMKNNSSSIGFEENGGFFYAPLNIVRDGAITTALILDMLSYYKKNPGKINKNMNKKDNNTTTADSNNDGANYCSRISMSQIYSMFGNTYQIKSSLKLKNTSIIPKVLDVCRNHGSAKKIEDIDGIKIWFDNLSWIMFRPSGTEPLLRIYGESDDHLLLDSKVREYVNLITKLDL